MQMGIFTMKAVVRFLSVACVALFAGGAFAQAIAPPPPPAPTPARISDGTSHGVDSDELRYAPVRGPQSKPTALVLNECRAKISKPVSMSAVYATYYKRTGWWCRYKLKSAH